MGFPPFTVAAQPRIEWGWGSARKLSDAAAGLGSRPAIFFGRSYEASGGLSRLVDSLRAAGVSPVLASPVGPEPGLEALQLAMDEAEGCDSVIGIGGGSVLDVAKAAAALAGTGVAAHAYFAGAAIPPTGRPILAVPTTSGTGSEVTWVAVLVDAVSRRKASIRGAAMMPAVALVDPELTVSCPPAVTAACGADALVQAIEAYTSRHATPYTDSLALQAAVLAGSHLERAVGDGDDREAREAMSLASMMAGQALNTSRLGLVHGLAHPLGAVTGAAHGLLCGLLMPSVMRFNLACSAPKYGRLARALRLCGPEEKDDAAAAVLIEWFEKLLVRLGIATPLSALGFSPSDVDRVARETMPSGSTAANPRPIDEATARQVLESCL